MNRFALSVRVAAVLVCALPGVSFAQVWSAEGPATRHDSGYVDPWSSSGPGMGVMSGRGYSPSYYPAYQSFYVPAYTYTPTWYSNPQPLVLSSSGSSTSPLTLEEEQEARADATHAAIQVRVPANAEIWFDNHKTRQTGSMRTFVSPPLETGKTFTYNIHARWMDSSGKVIDQTKQVEVQAGKRSMADFTPELTKSKL